MWGDIPPLADTLRVSAAISFPSLLDLYQSCKTIASLSPSAQLIVSETLCDVEKFVQRSIRGGNGQERFPTAPEVVEQLRQSSAVLAEYRVLLSTGATSKRYFSEAQFCAKPVLWTSQPRTASKDPAKRFQNLYCRAEDVLDCWQYISTRSAEQEFANVQRPSNSTTQQKDEGNRTPQQKDVSHVTTDNTPSRQSPAPTTAAGSPTSSESSPVDPFLESPSASSSPTTTERNPSTAPRSVSSSSHQRRQTTLFDHCPTLIRTPVKRTRDGSEVPSTTTAPLQQPQQQKQEAEKTKVKRKPPISACWKIVCQDFTRRAALVSVHSTARTELCRHRDFIDTWPMLKREVVVSIPVGPLFVTLQMLMDAAIAASSSSTTGSLENALLDMDVQLVLSLDGSRLHIEVPRLQRARVVTLKCCDLPLREPFSLDGGMHSHTLILKRLMELLLKLSSDNFVANVEELLNLVTVHLRDVSQRFEVAECSLKKIQRFCAVIAANAELPMPPSSTADHVDDAVEEPEPPTVQFHWSGHNFFRSNDDPISCFTCSFFDELSDKKWFGTSGSEVVIPVHTDILEEESEYVDADVLGLTLTASLRGFTGIGRSKRTEPTLLLHCNNTSSPVRHRPTTTTLWHEDTLTDCEEDNEEGGPDAVVVVDEEVESNTESTSYPSAHNNHEHHHHAAAAAATNRKAGCKTLRVDNSKKLAWSILLGILTVGLRVSRQHTSFSFVNHIENQ